MLNPIDLAINGFCPFLHTSFGIRKFRCNRALWCLSAFASIPEQDIFTEDGLLSKVDSFAVKRFVNWIKEICQHPQKTRVVEFIIEAARIEMCVPWRV